MDRVALFCDIDDFCEKFAPQWRHQLLTGGERQRQRPATLALSEVMTMVVAFHQSGYRTLKHYYVRYVLAHLRWAFPRLVS